MKLPIPAFSVRNSLPESDESRAYAGSELLAVADRGSLRGKRDYAVIAMLVGCGLRRGELLGLQVDSIQRRSAITQCSSRDSRAHPYRPNPIMGEGSDR
ncbi:MAG: site-specific recombinase XerD [Candidatus Solibacter sp.]|nr:site-specific recombinase XerD [Candidatus Solibacter sp.]